MFTKLLLKHEKNNQTLSNDWLTYCHTGIYVHVTTFTFSIVIKLSSDFYKESSNISCK